jgi:hypothetical protein
VDLAPRALEDHPEHPRLHAELLEDLRVLGFQRRAVEREQRLPPQLRRHDRRALVRRLGELVRHLEEEQERELLHVLEAESPASWRTPA